MGDILDLLYNFINDEPAPSVKHLAQMAIARIEQQQQRIAELSSEADFHRQAALQFRKERDELAATAERLLEACELAHDNYGKILMTDPPQEAWKVNQVTAKLFEAITATSRQNLNAVKREVAKNAFITALHTDMQVGEEQQKAEEYANTKYPIGGK